MVFLPSFRKRDDVVLQSELSVSLDGSTPSLAAGVPTVINRSSSRSSLTSVNSFRKKKFHQYFGQIRDEELLLNYYSCALVADVLLPGHLYITPNYFAFYSNVFGHVTKLLIPTTSVLRISEAKTARFIPNAVVIATEEDRHVFCSLLSRNSTLRLMKNVWDAAKDPKPADDVLLPNTRKFPPPESLLDIDSPANFEEVDSGVLESDSDQTSTLPTACTSTDGLPTGLPTSATIRTKEAVPGEGILPAKPETIPSRLCCYLQPSTTIIAISVALLTVLYISAALMIVRIDSLHAAYLNHPLTSPGGFDKNHLLHYLNSNLDQIVKVRQSLQMLSQQLSLLSERSEAEAILRDVLDSENTRD